MSSTNTSSLKWCSLRTLRQILTNNRVICAVRMAMHTFVYIPIADYLGLVIPTCKMNHSIKASRFFRQGPLSRMHMSQENVFNQLPTYSLLINTKCLHSLRGRTMKNVCSLAHFSKAVQIGRLDVLHMKSWSRVAVKIISLGEDFYHCWKELVQQRSIRC